MTKAKTPKRAAPTLSDREAERTVLGGMLTDSTLVDEVAQVLHAEDFSSAPHQHIFALIVELSAVAPVDVGGLASACIERGAETYGGIAYVWTLGTACPSVEGVMLQVRHLQALAIRRDARLYAFRIIEATEQTLALDEVLAAVDGGAASLRRPDHDPARSFGWTSATSLANRLGDDLETRRNRAGGLRGISCGLESLDRRIGGLVPGELLIVGARPAMGKTGLAACIARNVAADGHTVGFFNLEVRGAAVRDRILASTAGVRYAGILNGQLDRDELSDLLDANERLAGWPLYIDDAPNVSVADIRARVRRLKSDRPDLVLVVVDYVQLCRVDVAKGENRAMALGEVSRGLKLVAREFDLCVLALSQVNRGVEGREEKRPTMADLRESGNLEQDADIVAFLYRDEVYNPGTPDKGIAEFIVAKHRNGEIGKDRLSWDGTFQRFRDLDTRHDGFRSGAVVRYPGPQSYTREVPS